jgi:hypothetical protein
MLTGEQVDLIAAIGRMFYVLAFLAGEGRPLRARAIATRLRTEYETVRNYLEALAGLRVAARTGRGWIATHAGQKLVLQIAGLPMVWASSPTTPPGRFSGAIS